ncbi:MAG: prephenate dehydrogenase/arogenate dehydrogenase family protein [Thermomicrobiales bacterium]|nr:prephenate dehydrogenase/arogenate dehydrogenase family protein [Thermomicrobiales bacterium]
MQRVAIVGLGLIGGSIGIGLRQWSAENSKSGQSALEVAGFDQNLEHQSRAKKLGAVDRAEWELRKAVADADLVVLATPVVAMREILSDIAPLLKSGAVITDTASTKADVVQWAKEILPVTVHFVGGHPMAGKSESIDGAEGTLFTGATWCICPSVSANDEAVRTVLGMVAALGAEAFFVDPVEHDAYVAGVSHMPFVISAAIVNALTADPGWKDMKSLTAGGFRDTTRLASGSPAMHRDIALTNAESLDRWVSSMIGQLQDFQSRLSQDEESRADAIDEFFTNARDRRAEWAVQTSREAELLGAPPEAASEGIGDQMSRMFLGGFMRKKRVDPTKTSNGAGGRTP